MVSGKILTSFRLGCVALKPVSTPRRRLPTGRKAGAVRISRWDGQRAGVLDHGVRFHGPIAPGEAESGWVNLSALAQPARNSWLPTLTVEAGAIGSEHTA
jgi:hypothetical protein